MNAFLAQAPVAWYVARAAGLVAFGLLTLSVWLGLGMSTRLLGPKRQKSLFGWHQTLAWTGLSMLALHAGALLFDPTLHFGLASVLAPFASAVAPGRSRSRRRRRLAHTRARAVLQDAEANRPARLAQAALRELRRLRPRTRARAHRRHRPQGHRRPPARRDRGRARDLARPHAHPAPPPRTRRPPRDPGRGMTTAGGPGSTSRHPLPPHRHRRPQSKGDDHVQNPDRPLPLQRLRQLRRARPDVFEVDHGGLVSLRTGLSDDPGVLEAAEACPMAAISITEEAAA